MSNSYERKFDIGEQFRAFLNEDTTLNARVWVSKSGSTLEISDCYKTVSLDFHVGDYEFFFYEGFDVDSHLSDLVKERDRFTKMLKKIDVLKKAISVLENKIEKKREINEIVIDDIRKIKEFGENNEED